MIKIHVLHTGKVCVSPHLPFGGENCSPLKASGVFGKQSERLWLPVSCYLIEHPKGLVLVDTGWHRSMSPQGELDKRAGIASLGSARLWKVNQGVLPLGQAIDEQLEALGIAPSQLDYVLLTHLDCDHANGLKLVSDAKRILVSSDELGSVGKTLVSRTRYQKRWWEGTKMEAFDWSGQEGPHGRSFDVFGDGSLVCVAIPGHSDGLFSLKVVGDDGRFVLLCSDGGYGARSWKDMILSGIANDRAAQKASLEWIRAQSEDPLCVACLANHDSEVEPQVIELA